MAPTSPDSVKIDLLLYIAIEQQKDLDIAHARIGMYQKLYTTEKRPWYDELLNSTAGKVALFVSGVYLGSRMIRVVD